MAEGGAALWVPSCSRFVAGEQPQRNVRSARVSDLFVLRQPVVVLGAGLMPRRARMFDHTGGIDSLY